MPSLETLIGLAAAFFTTASYIPQVWKGWRTRSVGDLSLRMILILSTGIALWVAYGFLRGDAVIVGANALCLFFLANLLFLKLREIFGGNATTFSRDREKVVAERPDEGSALRFAASASARDGADERMRTASFPPVTALRVVRC